MRVLYGRTFINTNIIQLYKPIIIVHGKMIQPVLKNSIFITLIQNVAFYVCAPFNFGLCKNIIVISNIKAYFWRIK